MFQTPLGNLIAVEHLHYPQLAEFEQKYDLFLPKVEVSAILKLDPGSDFLWRRLVITRAKKEYLRNLIQTSTKYLTVTNSIWINWSSKQKSHHRSLTAANYLL